MFKEKIRIQLLGGSLTDHGSYTDGNYQGYPVVITTESTVYHVRINAVSAQDPDNTQLAQYLEYQKQNVKHLVDYSCTSTSVSADDKNAGSKRKQSSGYDQRCCGTSDSVSAAAVTICPAVNPAAAHRSICQIMR